MPAGDTSLDLLRACQALAGGSLRALLPCRPGARSRYHSGLGQGVSADCAVPAFIPRRQGAPSPVPLPRPMGLHASRLQLRTGVCQARTPTTTMPYAGMLTRSAPGPALPSLCRVWEARPLSHDRVLSAAQRAAHLTELWAARTQEALPWAAMHAAAQAAERRRAERAAAVAAAVAAVADASEMAP